MERAFGTLQGRLPQELRVRGVTSMAAANLYLRDTFRLGESQDTSAANSCCPDCGSSGVPFSTAGAASGSP